MFGVRPILATSTLDYYQASHQHPSLGIILVGDFSQLPDESIGAYRLIQAVTSATRHCWTNFSPMFDWYSTLAQLPAVGSSDLVAVLTQAGNNPDHQPGTDIVVYILCPSSERRETG